MYWFDVVRQPKIGPATAGIVGGFAGAPVRHRAACGCGCCWCWLGLINSGGGLLAQAHPKTHCDACYYYSQAYESNMLPLNAVAFLICLQIKPVHGEQKPLLTSTQRLPLLYSHTLHRYPHLLPYPSQKRKQLQLGISEFSSCVKHTLTLIHQNLSTECAYKCRTCRYKTEIIKTAGFPKDDNLNVCKTTSTRFGPNVQIRGFTD